MKKKIFLTIFSFFLISSVSFADDLVLTGNIESGWHYINDSIYTQDSTIIENGVSLDIIAQGTINLNPGFTAVPGSILSAKVSPDTDGDLILDIVEDRTCLNSNLSDSDGDGIPDGTEDANHNGILEIALGETSACDEDMDSDLMDDKWELDNGLDPYIDDASDDSDGDSLSNYIEYYFYTQGHTSDPNDINSTPPTGLYYIYDEQGRTKTIIKVK